MQVLKTCLIDRLELAAKEGSSVNFSKMTIDLNLDVVSTAAFKCAQVAALICICTWLTHA